jgi:hypothetical protein
LTATEKQTGVTIIKIDDVDYISITDIAKVKNPDANAVIWIDATSAIGIISKSGRYGGTFAHNELICLSNMENLNAVFINEGLPQRERLIKLNQIAIQQMRVLLSITVLYPYPFVPHHLFVGEIQIRGRQDVLKHITLYMLPCVFRFRHPKESLPSRIAFEYRSILLRTGIFRYFLLSSFHLVT